MTATHLKPGKSRKRGLVKGKRVENMGKVRNDNPKNSFGKKCLEKAKVK
jgi:hypothetical protein